MSGTGPHKTVFVIGDNITSPIGNTSSANMVQLKNGVSGVQQHVDERMLKGVPFSASLFAKDAQLTSSERYTKFEQLLIASVADATKELPGVISDERTILIISTTKGNISLLETKVHNAGLYKRVALHTSAQLVARHFGFVHKPVIVSNACISGVLAIITGMRLLKGGDYDYAVVVGADVISNFVLSGFASFQALSAGVCRPFDRDRTGINLGEGAAAVVLSVQANTGTDVAVLSGAISNDANHISGPSRTGEELAMAIKKSIADAQLDAGAVSFISAHGTATIYNDEMEANALYIAELQGVPVNSLKGYYGHTLGAAGLIETVVSLHSMQENIVLPTPGFETLGVTKEISVTAQLLQKPLRYCLKTASGFGGCNAALIIGKQ